MSKPIGTFATLARLFTFASTLGREAVTEAEQRIC
jgi:hypothetical protein